MSIKYLSLIIIYTFLLLFPDPAEPSKWYNINWDYRKLIKIDNSTNPKNLTDYQVKVELTTSNFDYTKAISTGADIRFSDSDGITLIDHWNETWDTAGTSIFWVEIPYIAAYSTSSFYLYYGNGNAISASDGDDTFEFYDGFDIWSEKSGLETITDIGHYEEANPVIPTGGENDSDRFIREIGNVLYEAGETSKKYKTWYTGYNAGGNIDERIHFAYSEDGINWTKSPLNPVIDNYRAEDPFIVKNGSVYYLYAEDKEIGLPPYYRVDRIRRWSSIDGENWSDEGQITGITNAQSPVVWIEGSTWYMLYENYPVGPLDIRLATSSDGLTWTPHPSNPVFNVSNTNWGAGYVVPDDIIKKGSVYYMSYHGNKGYIGIFEAVTKSTDLVNWTDIGIIGSDASLQHIATAAIFNDGTEDVFLYYGLEEIGIKSEGIYRGYPIIADPIHFKANPLKWTEHHQGTSNDNYGFAYIESNALRLSGESGADSSVNIMSTSTFINDIIIEIKKRVSSDVYHNISLGAGNITDINDTSSDWWNTVLQSGYTWITASSSDGIIGRMPAAGEITRLQTGIYVGTAASYETHKLIYKSNGDIEWYIDDVKKDNGTINDITFLNDAKRILISQGEHSTLGGADQYIEWIRVRKFTSIEPLTYFMSIDSDLDGYEICLPGEDPIIDFCDCNDNDLAINPAATEIWYDGDDQNCDGWNDYDQDMDTYVDENYLGFEGGTSPFGGDCDDSDIQINPGTLWYQDNDGDSFGDYSLSLQQCIKPTGPPDYVLDNNDYDDNDSNIGAPVMIDSGTVYFYSSLQDAYDAAEDNDTIQAISVIFIEDLLVDRNISVTLQGGYNGSYSTISGDTILNGDTDISNGTLTIENFFLQP